jgi:hypothetical protein
MLVTNVKKMSPWSWIQLQQLFQREFNLSLASGTDKETETFITSSSQSCLKKGKPILSVFNLSQQFEIYLSIKSPNIYEILNDTSQSILKGP